MVDEVFILTDKIEFKTCFVHLYHLKLRSYNYKIQTQNETQALTCLVRDEQDQLPQTR